MEGQEGASNGRAGNTLMAGNWLPQPRLPKFSGEEGQVEAFTAETDRVLTSYGLDGVVGVELLLQNLEGLARREVLELAAEDRSNPGQVLRHLRSVFGSRKSPVLWLEDFNARRQLEGETVLAFCHALQDLARKVRAAGGHLSDTDVMDRFVARLSNGQLRRELRRSCRENPSITLLELRDEALQWLEGEKDGKDQPGATPQLSHVFQRPSGDSATATGFDAILAAMQGVERRLTSLESNCAQEQQPPTTAAQRSPGRMDVTCREARVDKQEGSKTADLLASIPGLITEVQYLREQLSKLAQENQQLRGRMEQGSAVGPSKMPSLPPSKSARPTCWWCQKSGHQKRDCQARRRHQARRACQPEQRVEKPKPPPSGQRPAVHHPKRRRKRGVVCWNCRNSGHVRSECRGKVRKKGQDVVASQHLIPLQAAKAPPVGLRYSDSSEEEEEPESVGQVLLVRPVPAPRTGVPRVHDPPDFPNPSALPTSPEPPPSVPNPKQQSPAGCANSVAGKKTPLVRRLTRVRTPVERLAYFR